VGKILAIFLIAYFGMYLYRKWEFKKKNSIGKIRYYEQELAKQSGYKKADIIDIDIDIDDDDNHHRPKYLH